MPDLRPLAACLLALPASIPAAAGPSDRAAPAGELFVDPARGDDAAAGSREAPLRSISAAIAELPDPLSDSVVIHLAPGAYATTGGVGMPKTTLELWRRMRPGASVVLAGPDQGEPAILAWDGERRMIDATEGTWSLARVQIGAFRTSQRRGVQVVSPARVILEDVVFRLRSESDAAVWAHDGGRASLRGAIAINEHLAGLDSAEDETFSGLLATDHGVIEFDESRGSLAIGNGSLSVRTYGSIRLGCERASITSWTAANALAVNNGGRIDLRGTPIVLRAARADNVAIGLEHDGHVLAEDAHVTIVGPNDAAIALQKASTFTCNDVELQGAFGTALWAKSGSLFVGRFLGDVPRLEASTGASIHLEELRGRFVGPAVARSGGVITLPGRTIRSD